MDHEVSGEKVELSTFFLDLSFFRRLLRCIYDVYAEHVLGDVWFSVLGLVLHDLLVQADAIVAARQALASIGWSDKHATISVGMKIVDTNLNVACKQWNKLPIKWCRMPSTVCTHFVSHLLILNNLAPAEQTKAEHMTERKIQSEASTFYDVIEQNCIC